MVFEFGGLKLELLKERAVWEATSRSLFLSDTHFGKAGHFRKAGIPVSEHVHLEDFRRLKTLILKTDARHVYLLGDLFHSEWNVQWDILKTFLFSFSNVDFHLMKGNHDILPMSMYDSTLLEVHQTPVRIGKLILSHEPLERVDRNDLNLCGHLHPGIVLSGKGRQRLKLPCFLLHRSRLVLPAFGAFTGLMTINSWKDKEVFIVTPKEVIRVEDAFH